jgi:CDP-diacylglycerol---serine O-phosphatidyltransferase
MTKDNSIIKQIPNLLTSMNIFLGCMAIAFAFERNLQIAGFIIFLAAIIDFLDGYFARSLNAISSFGKTLDSLADIVSFGVAPSIILYQMLIMSLTYHDSSFNIETATILESIILYTSFLVAVFSGIRLARFTISANSDNNYFYGLPTPAAAILIASIALILVETENVQLQDLVLNTYFLVILVILLSLLMVSGLRLFSFKFATYAFSKNVTRYIFLIISLILIIIFNVFAIPVIFFIYIFLSLLQNWNALPH